MTRLPRFQIPSCFEATRIGCSASNVRLNRDHNPSRSWWRVLVTATCGVLLLMPLVEAQEKPASKSTAPKAVAKSKTKAPPPPKVEYPPALPNGQMSATVTGPELIQAPSTIAKEVLIAKTPPTVDFVYYPGQTYEGKPWSNWGHSTFANGKYYSAIGDHLAPQGNAFVFEYDLTSKTLRRVTDIRSVLKLPEGHYTPGKIHSRLTMGQDGWLYYSTHRGSTKATTDANHYRGDWILRCHPATGESEVVECGPVPKHCIPNGLLDPKRMIFYGGTAPGDGGDVEGIQFFAYDVRQKKVLFAGQNGPSRAMLLAGSTGRVYFTPGLSESPVMRFDPTSSQPPQMIPGELGLRAATDETPQGKVFTVSFGRKDSVTELYSFDTKTEQIQKLGPAAVGVNQYVAALEVDRTGRFVYYVPGAHGGSEQDGSAVVQFDTQTNRRKVIAFLHPLFEKQFGCVPKGTYGLAIDDSGETLCITWNVSRGSRAWDCCGLTAIHIPAEERR